MDENNQQNQVPQDSTGADILLNMESMIKSSVELIDKNRSELKKVKEMLSSFLLNDPVYSEQDKAVKSATKLRTKTKSELFKQPEAAKLNQQAKELSTSIKEAQQSMSDYLREYQRLSGSNEIQNDKGEVLQIVYVARLVKPSSRFK